MQCSVWPFIVSPAWPEHYKALRLTIRLLFSRELWYLSLWCESPRLQQHNAVSTNAHCFQSTLPSAYCTYRSVVNSRLFQKHFYTCLQRTVTSERSTYSNTLDFRNLWLAPSMRAMLQSSSYFYYVYVLWSSAKPTHFSWVRWKGSLILSAELSRIKNLSHFSLESV